MRIRLIIILVAIFSACLALPLDAQVSVGINAGLIRTNFSGDSPDGIGYFAPKLGLSSSLRIDYRFSQAVSLSLQAGYYSLRTKYVVMDDSSNKAVDSTYFKINSLSLPLHAIVWSENGRFYVLAGFEFDYTLDFRGEFVREPYDLKNEVQEFNIYAQFGSGFIIPLGKPYLSFELRYSQGLVDLNKSLVHQDSFLPRTKLINVSFFVGFHVPLGNSEFYQVKKKNR